MPFEVFMERCLYDSVHGYYAAPGRPVGRTGDFQTSVSVGSVFGELIARWAADSWAALGRPATVALVEQGAHDGQLMADVLVAIGQSENLDFRRAVRPTIIEPLATRRESQRATIAATGITAADGGSLADVAWSRTPEELEGHDASSILFFANELLDAFPVARWRFDGSGWHRVLVGLDGAGGLTWVTERAEGFRLPGWPQGVAANWPAGYETETCPGVAGWIEALGRAMPRGGRALIFDYGRGAEDYYAPHRTSGTLRGYWHHRRWDDPLAAPGETDLTADVNFSQLAEIAKQAGFLCRGPERQGAFLTQLAVPRLLATPRPDAAWQRQFHTLTHPNHLGHAFQAVVLERAG
ncbi:MAG: class I SAM-dependent methyltransferase [Verrucomicrobiales bacterium]